MSEEDARHQNGEKLPQGAQSCKDERAKAFHCVQYAQLPCMQQSWSGLKHVTGMCQVPQTVLVSHTRQSCRDTGRCPTVLSSFSSKYQAMSLWICRPRSPEVDAADSKMIRVRQSGCLNTNSTAPNSCCELIRPAS